MEIPTEVYAVPQEFLACFVCLWQALSLMSQSYGYDTQGIKQIYLSKQKQYKQT